MNMQAKVVKIFCILFTVTTITACGSDSNDSEIQPLDLNGSYALTATALTEIDTNGGTCGDGSGTMTVLDGVLGGSVLSTNGNQFDISGTVSASGDISGGFALSGENLVNVVGELNNTGGSGTWEDALGCNGTWDAAKEE